MRSWMVRGLLMGLLLSGSSSFAQRLIEIPFTGRTPSLSPNGRVVLLGEVAIWTEQEGLRYLRADGRLTRNRAEAMNAYATALSYDGSIIVGGGRAPQWAFRWRLGVGLEYLELPSNAWRRTFASTISWDGRVIYGEGELPPNWWQGWRWQDGVAVEVPILASKCSGDGSCAVGEWNYTPVRWCVGRGHSGPGGVGISADGRIISGANWRWVEGRGFERIVPPHYYGMAGPISGDGRIVVGSYHRSLDPDDLEDWAFIWREGVGFEDLTEKYAWLIDDPPGGAA